MFMRKNDTNNFDTQNPLAVYNRDGGVRILLMLSAWLLTGLSAGCESTDPTEGYTNRSLYRAEIRTVFVEMFQSETFRRNVEFELTEAVVSQLELHSTYKVVSDRREADSIVYGTIKRIHEGVRTAQRELDRPVENEVVLSAVVTWKDLRSGELILDNRLIKVKADYAVLLGAGRTSAERKVANQAAVRIVEAMEQPW
jgi:hypothetical protein